MADAPGPSRHHVCFLTSSAPLGPGDAYSPFILGLARRLVERGHRVTIVMPHVAGSATREVLGGVEFRRYRYLPTPSAETLGSGGGMLPGLKRRKTDVFKVPFLLRGQAQALRMLHAEDPIHLLHSHWLVPQGVIGGRFADAEAIPHVGTAHGSELLALRFPGVDWLLRYAIARCDMVTVNSRSLASELRSRCPTDKIRIIPIGAREAEPAAVEGNLDIRRSLTSDGTVVGFVGRVVEEKGILEFVRVVARIRARGIAAVGLVVGGGSAEPAAGALAEELGIAENVQFVGPVPPERVAEQMSVMDVLVIPSRFEAQGIVAAEAMLLGLPVAAFATGGLEEIVIDGETGLSVAAGDTEGMADAVEQLLREPALRRRVALRGRDLARARYSIDAAADRFDEAYRELLEG